MTKKPETPAKKLNVRTHTPRPDELSRETFEFITAVDQYKRRHMRSFLEDTEVLTILANLGYHLPGSAPSAAPSKAEQAAYAEAKNEYRVREGRLFPTWSEVFELLTQLGYERTDHEDAA